MSTSRNRMSQQTKHSLENNLVSFTIENKPNCVVEFDVKASSALVQRAHQNAIKAVAKETTIPGFRKGKAPEDVIKRTFKAAIDKKWEQLVGEEAFAECEALAKIPVLNSQTRVNFKMKHFGADSAEMSFQFETEPAIPQIDYTKINLQDVKKEVVTEEKIHEVIHKIRMFFAKWENVFDRAVQAGDYAIIDLDLLQDEKSERVFSNTRLEVKKPAMADWMRELVIGMSIGESKEGFSAVDEDATDEEKARFTPKKVKITLNGIQEAILPPVDDDLAAKVGAESADIMKERLKVLMEKQAKEAQKTAYREQLSAYLIDHLDFEIPGSLLYTELHHRSKQLFSNPSFKKRIEGLSEEEKKEEFKKIETQAKDALKLFYLCRQVLMENHVTLGPEDLTQDIQSPLDAMFADRDLANPNKTEEQKNLLMSRILLIKAQDLILDKILK